MSKHGVVVKSVQVEAWQTNGVGARRVLSFRDVL